MYVCPGDSQKSGEMYMYMSFNLKVKSMNCVLIHDKSDNNLLTQDIVRRLHLQNLISSEFMSPVGLQSSIVHFRRKVVGVPHVRTRFDMGVFQCVMGKEGYYVEEGLSAIKIYEPVTFKIYSKRQLLFHLIIKSIRDCKFRDYSNPCDNLLVNIDCELWWQKTPTVTNPSNVPIVKEVNNAKVL
ncbi:hypothetical protein CEXT_12271 [Caerostris extrusa]|uniref:Uncharacterized protein n=1 Tax=Caerostris extrusa TaxID=172846 RepID=A0AAV4SK18_CAEEX|nr:hypothetical protein CEXT_12271 [Caerostris extrusa]